MSKILKNTTINAIIISDTGITIPASPGSYTIPTQDDLLWAASNNIITKIGSGDIIVNDGTNNLSISDGTSLIKGLFPKKVNIEGATDSTRIGNIGDALKITGVVTAFPTTNTAILTSVVVGVTSTTILVSNPNRKGFLLFNNTNGPAFIALKSTASTTEFSFKLDTSDSFYEGTALAYTGPISGIVTGGGVTSADIKVTEFI